MSTENISTKAFFMNDRNKIGKIESINLGPMPDMHDFVLFYVRRNPIILLKHVLDMPALFIYERKVLNFLVRH